MKYLVLIQSLCIPSIFCMFPKTMYPLHHAIQFNDRIMFDNALDNNADVNQIDMHDQEPLDVAIKSPNDRIWFVNRLVQHPNIRYDSTFVLEAIQHLKISSRKDSIQKLIQFFPRSVNMWEDIPKYYNLKFVLRIIHANIEDSTTIARQQLIDDFLNAEIINLEAESKKNILPYLIYLYTIIRIKALIIHSSLLLRPVIH